MIELIGILLVTGGTLFWLYFFSGFDPHPEPKRVILEAFLLGIVGALLALAVEKALVPGTLRLRPDATFVVSVVEEIAKFVPVYLVIFFRKDFSDPIDAVMYMLVAGLGFSFAEDILLALTGQSMQIIFFRIFLAKLLHLTASGLLGYGYALTAFTGRRIQLFWGLAAAIAWHWFYDFALLVTGDNIASFGFIGFFLVFCLGYLMKTLKALSFEHNKSRTF